MIRSTRLLISVLASAAMVAGLVAVPSSAAAPQPSPLAGPRSPAAMGRASQHAAQGTAAEQRKGATAAQVSFSPPAGAWAPDGTRLDVFQAFDGSLVHKFWTSSSGWSEWIDVGPPPVPIGFAPSATWATDQSRLDVFAADVNGRLYQITQTAGGWSGWTDLGGTLVAAPSASSTAGGRIDVFGIGTDFRLYQKVWLGVAWTDWFAFDQPAVGIGSAPAATWTSGGGRIDVFVTGFQDGHLYQKFWLASGGWSGWVDLGGILASYPSASWTSNGGRIDVFGMGPNGRLYQKTWPGFGSWLEWHPFAPPAAGAFGISATWTANGGRLDFFTAGDADAHVYQMSWQASTGWVGWTDLG